MVISISPKLWDRACNGDLTARTAINQILILVQTGKHILIFENNIELERITSCNYFNSFIETILAYSKQDFYTNLTSHKLIVRVTDKQLIPKKSTSKICFNGDLVINIEQSVELQYLNYEFIETYLARPLYIVVENSDSDRAFIKTVYDAITNSNIELSVAVQEKLNLDNDTRLEFRMGGGNTTPRVINSFIFPTRAICIIDSDKKYPDQNYDEKILGLIHECQDRNIDVLVLQRREIENYLPNVAIKQWLDTQNRYSELEHPFFNFNDIQRSYFDLKKGLLYKEYSETNEIKSLFEDILQGVDVTTYEPKTKIINGFGNNVWQAFYEVSCGIEEFGSECIAEFDSLVSTIHSKL